MAHAVIMMERLQHEIGEPMSGRWGSVLHAVPLSAFSLHPNMTDMFSSSFLLYAHLHRFAHVGGWLIVCLARATEGNRLMIVDEDLRIT